jgi:hypothetical protein
MGLGPFILGAAGIQGATSLAGGKKGASAATDAASIQAQSAMAALAEQKAVRDQNVNLLSPFVNYGTGGIPALTSTVDAFAGQPIDTSLPQFTQAAPQFAGLPPFTLQAPTVPDVAALKQTPGYQFVFDQALKGAQSQIAASGRGRGGPAIQTANYTAGGIAASTWPQVYNAMLQQFGAGVTGYQTGNQATLQDFGARTTGYQTARDTFLSNTQNLLASKTLNLNQRQQILAALQQRVGTGLTAGGALAGANLQYANAAGNYLTGAGAATASGIVGSTNALTAGLTGVGNAATGGVGQYLGYNLAQQYLSNQGNSLSNPYAFAGGPGGVVPSGADAGGFYYPNVNPTGTGPVASV